MDVAMKKDQFDISSLFRPCTIQLLDYDLSLFGSSTFSMSLRIRLHKTKKKNYMGICHWFFKYFFHRGLDRCYKKKGGGGVGCYLLNMNYFLITNYYIYFKVK